MVKALTAEEASILLKQALAEWWIVYSSGQLEKAASLSADIASYARALKTATFILYAKKEGKGDPSAESQRGESTGIPPAKGV